MISEREEPAVRLRAADVATMLPAKAAYLRRNKPQTAPQKRTAA